MLPDHETTRLSKFLSLVLRHRPDKLGLALDAQGWTHVADLLTKLNRHGYAVNLDALRYVVATNNKKRFAFSADETMIRANQGHSVGVTLGYAPQPPPPVLYHGTATRFLAAIRAGGLTKQKRHHVHLSADPDTATQVGRRHGRPVVLTVRAADMAAAGYVFYQSDNGVWLTDHVPPAYLDFNPVGGL